MDQTTSAEFIILSPKYLGLKSPVWSGVVDGSTRAEALDTLAQKVDAWRTSRLADSTGIGSSTVTYLNVAPDAPWRLVSDVLTLLTAPRASTST